MTILTGKIWSLIVATLLVSGTLLGQTNNNRSTTTEQSTKNREKLKLYQNTRGLLLGYERGRTDYLLVGYHYNWKKIRLKKPTIHAVEGIGSVAPFTGILGLQASYWQRQGRFKLTYGGQVGYFTNFEQSTLSLGPTVGIRLLGLHAQTGFNLLSEPEVEANRLFLRLSLLLGGHTRVHSKRGDKKKDILKW